MPWVDLDKVMEQVSKKEIEFFYKQATTLEGGSAEMKYNFEEVAKNLLEVRNSPITRSFILKLFGADPKMSDDNFKGNLIFRLRTQLKVMGYSICPTDTKDVFKIIEKEVQIKESKPKVTATPINEAILNVPVKVQESTAEEVGNEPINELEGKADSFETKLISVAENEPSHIDDINRALQLIGKRLVTRVEIIDI